MVKVNSNHPVDKLGAILSNRDLYSSLDYHFARFIAKLANQHQLETALAAALLSSKTNAGNICLDLEEFANKPPPLPDNLQNDTAYICPSLSNWMKYLLQSGVAGQGSETFPLVLDGSRLYLRRYWEYENFIISFVQQRAVPITKDLNYAKLAKDINKLFDKQSTKNDLQKIAAFAAATRLFCVISGGPGTGKTSTVAKILSILAKQNNTGKMRILLGAPTGKAASRLQETLSAADILLNGPEPLQATTLHRMLGYIPNSPYFRHDAENPLAADVVVIDEASMVDLPLMAKLMQAMPSEARLILLGDRHQLASVQPGSVLGDMCSSDIMGTFSSGFCQHAAKLSGNFLENVALTKQASSSVKQDSFVELVHSYRFPADSGIARLSSAVREGVEASAYEILQDEKYSSVSWSALPSVSEFSKNLKNLPGLGQFASLFKNRDVASCFSALDNFRILCALRIGPHGIEKINSHLEQLFAQHRSSLPGNSNVSLPVRPIMVTGNDYNLQLFNGDVGIMLSEQDRLKPSRGIFRDNTGKFRNIAAGLLPDHETVYALTVHKSQGSEFDNVLLILPDQDSPLLTRELIYTAITRARKNVVIWGNKKVFCAAVKRRIKRSSGLSDALWG